MALEEPDMEAMNAVVDLVGRTGARELQVGYLHDDASADWYAHAQYKGARITAENHPGPVEAMEALATRLLIGAQCQHCHGLVALDADGAFAFRKAVLVDGRQWDVEQSAPTRRCRWRRAGPRWVRGCERTAG
jgi:hypothetical protein